MFSPAQRSLCLGSQDRQRGKRHESHSNWRGPGKGTYLIKLQYKCKICEFLSKRGVTEAEAMGRILQERGVEEERLILEKEAVDTTTNAHNVLKLVQEEVLVYQEKVQLIIVTSAYHMPRYAWLFRS